MHIRLLSRWIPFLVSGLVLAQFGARPARALDLVFIPESHHQQFKTFAFFADSDSTSLLWRNAGRAWIALGDALALLGSEENHLQLVAYGSANASMRLNAGGNTLLTDTIDARVGLEFEYAMTEDTRFVLGWTHYSGHISDDILDKDLIGSNLGDEWIAARVIHDVPGLLRVGGAIEPVVGSDPGMKAFAADQFVEVYPLGTSTDIRKGNPYLALGLQEYGPLQVDLSFHAQAGVYFGEHMGPRHTQSIRFAAGFYTGDDPRLKYMQFKFNRVTFGYAGILVDL